MANLNQGRAQIPPHSSCPITITWGNTGRVIHTTLGEAIRMAIQMQEESLPEEVRIKRQRRHQRKAAGIEKAGLSPEVRGETLDLPALILLSKALENG